MNKRLAILVALTACASAPRATFRSTDPAFVATAASATPIVYLERDAVPDGPMRSVGVIEVTSSRRQAAVDAAGAKGRELGCWAVIERTVFEATHAPHARLFGARTILAHGGGPHVEHVAPPRATTYVFHCVLRGGGDRA